MSREASKYFAYARECARQAEQAIDTERRDQLMELSRVWIAAAVREEAFRRGLDLAGAHAPASRANVIVDR
ncbi:MAG TPA: hypothetical protein VH934_06415 [Xanthobacteraceae bacterium]